MLTARYSCTTQTISMSIIYGMESKIQTRLGLHFSGENSKLTVTLL